MKLKINSQTYDARRLPAAVVALSDACNRIVHLYFNGRWTALIGEAKAEGSTPWVALCNAARAGKFYGVEVVG